MVRWMVLMWMAFMVTLPAMAKSPQTEVGLLGEAGPLVLLHTDVDAMVQWGMAVVDVRQTFHNPYDVPMDATYVFPLSPGAAVRAMTLTCGDRELVAHVDEKEAARKAYEQAVQQGRKAALLEQQRPDVFTQEVGRLCPGEVVEVSLQYVEALEPKAEVWSLVFPTTVGERYDPRDLDLPPFGPDAGRRIDVALTLDEGLPLGSIYSDSHTIDITDTPTGARITLADGDDVPNKDVHVAWSLATKTPSVAALVARPDPADDATIAIRIEPPPLATIDVHTPRELVFVMDASCSMNGVPWDATVRLVEEAIDDLRPDDTFNLVKFSSASSALFSTPQPATGDHRAQAKGWMQAFVGGGTEMTAGIVEALTMPGNPDALRIVLLLTDGYIGNDQEVFHTTRDHLSDNDRIFALGVGSSPNRGLIEELAFHGRGDALYALLDTPVEEPIQAFADRIATPVLTDIELDLGSLVIRDQVPSVIPDLFAGQSLRIVGRTDTVVPTKIQVHGRRGLQRVTYDVWLDPHTIRTHEAVPTYWAREAIREAERNLETTSEQKKATVVPIALEHHLVSTYTSLVATDITPSPCGDSPWYRTGPNLPVKVETLLPAGTAGIAATGVGGLGLRGSGVGGGGNLGAIRSDPIILGSLDRSPVDDVIKRNMNKIRYCYERSLQSNHTLAGKVVVKFTIAADGSVSAASIKSSTLNHDQVESCLVGVFRRLKFLAPKGGGIVIVSYPFLFSPR